MSEREVPAHREVLADPARLAALDTVLPLATRNREAMDRLAELAATVMDAPVGMVNLIGEHRQAVVGWSGPADAQPPGRELELEVSYCTDTLVSGKPLYIDDAADEPGFADHPAHASLGFAAYAGVPLRDADGSLLGTVCVADVRAHRWRQIERRALEAVAESVVSEVALHRDVDRRQRLLDGFDGAPAQIAVTRGATHVVDYTNAAYRAVFGDIALGRPGRQALPDLPAELFALMDRVFATGERFAATDAPVRLTWPGEQEPRERWFDFSYSPVDRGTGTGRRGLLIVSIEVTDRVQARQDLQRRARHQELLARAAAALNRSLDPGVGLQQLAEAVVPELADLSTVHRLARPAAPGADPPLPVVTDRVAVAVAPGVLPRPPLRTGLVWDGVDDPVTATIRHGGMLRRATPDVPLWAGATGATATFRAGLDQVVLAPVVVEGLVVAVVAFGLSGHRRTWDDTELDVLAQVARFAGTALEHGLSYQRTRDSALVLQRSLLADPPAVDGLEICARYRPAGRDEVGGDWYDAFVRRTDPGGGDEIALVIGDVVGHDIEAAAAMGQLRATLRGIALDRSGGPAAALDRLDTINGRLRITPFATVLHAHLTRRAGTWTLTWSSAGHPPPVLVGPDGHAALLDQAAGPALINWRGLRRREAKIELPPGSTLILYTDGLVERPGTDIDDNLAAVSAHATRSAGSGVATLCDELLREAPVTDDVALLVLRIPRPGPDTPRS